MHAVFGLQVTGADPELQSSIRADIDGCGHFCQDGRVTVFDARHQHAHTNPRRSFSEPSQ
jgi:hypothetical protein